jgi:hypothetical protein
MTKRIDQFITSIIFLLILPLLPLVAEYLKTHDIKADSLTLCVTFYSLCLSVSTKSPLVFSVCLTMGIIDSFRYKGNSAVSGLPFPDTFEFYIFLVVFIMHFVERIKRHWIKAENFFTFNE